MDSATEVISDYRSLIQSLTSVVANFDLYEGGICLGNEDISLYSSKKESIDSFSKYFRKPDRLPKTSRIKIYLISYEETLDNLKLSGIKYGHFQNNEISFLQNTGNGALEVFDKKNLNFFIVTPPIEQHSDSISYFNWNSLKQILNKLDYINMHGAMVGRNDHGIFLSNKGGSGKSSLMVYSISQGLQTLGDDFLTVNKSEVDTFYSVFKHFKLSTSSPVIELARERFNEIGTFDNKQVFEISNEVGDTFRPRMKLKEILIPYIGNRIGIHEISKDDAFAKLLPSTLMMNSATLATIDTLRELLAATPVFQLELTPNLQEAFELIDSRLGTRNSNINEK